MSHDDRWRFRGAWLLLYMAIQACPSNDSYDIFRDGNTGLCDNEAFLELLPLSNTASLSAPTNKSSQMRAESHSKRTNDNGRYDSACSTVALDPDSQSPISSASRIWYAIFGAADNGSKTVSVANDVLGFIWPEKDAAEVLYQLGHPTKQLREDESAELREKFRMVLFPEYMNLVKNC